MRIELIIRNDGEVNCLIEEENMVPAQESESWLMAYNVLCGRVLDARDTVRALASAADSLARSLDGSPGT